MPDTVLVTTDDLEPAVRLRDAFAEEGYEVELLTAGERIRDVENPVLLVITGGLEEKRARRLLREAVELGRLAVLGLTDTPAHARPDVCRRMGLAECFVKPVDPAEVVLSGRLLIERRRLQVVTGIVGESEPILEALERVVQIAPVKATVLITGESGTGKELIARGIHALSPRRHRPFIAANVAALPETLLESELFGHEKGSFTGAVAQRKGLFELANRGTLFLDEIGEMPLATQTKLLRVLEEREFMRVGGEQPIQVDVRVIAATNQELRQLTEIGDFRRDLYYRLNVLSIALPPLRARREDIPLLIEAFVRDASREHDRPPVRISPDALKILVDHDWPGNVRELRNLVESMVVLAHGGVIQPDDIPPQVRGGGRTGGTLPVPVPRRERGDGGPGPELEFVFRTLLQLRVDMEELRTQFDEFRRTNQDAVTGPRHAIPYLPSPIFGGAGTATPIDVHDLTVLRRDDEDEEEEPGVVVYRRGMTMQDIEREAIIAALHEVDGNRRAAAEMLGIGERTLYRKIKEYEIPI